MREFQEKRKIKKLLYSKKTAVVLLLVTGFLIFSTIKVYIKSRNAISKSEEVKQELSELEKQKSELERDVSRLETETGLEEEIRKNLNAQKPGEKVLVIVDKNTNNDKMETGSRLGNFFSKIWQWVKSGF